MVIFILVILLPLILLVFMLIRNSQVYNERIKCLKIMSKQALDDINNGDFNWRRRYNFFDEVSYDNMLLQFWKPVHSFYQNYKEKLTEE